MAYRKVDEASLSAVADSIREKGGTTGALAFPDGFVSAVQAIQAGGGEAEQEYTRFYDYDGTLLYEFTVKEAQALTEMPEGVAHEGLVFEGWNWSLADLKALNYPMDVGALYNTDDGKARLYINISSEDQLNIELRMYQNKSGAMHVNFGDGSDTEIIDATGVVTIAHTYVSLGDYIIKIENKDKSATVKFGKNVYDSTAGGAGSLLSIPDILTRVEYADIKTSKSCFAYCKNLEVVVASKQAYSASGISFLECGKLKFFVVTDNDPVIGTEAFYNCISLRGICLANGFNKSSTENKHFYGCKNIERICYGETNFISSEELYNCKQLKNVYLPKNITGINNYAFSGCWKLKKIELPVKIDISNYAFAYCYRLSELNMKECSANGSAFMDCYSIDVITYEGKPAYINPSAFPSTVTTINVPWAEGEVANAPWGATNATINYNYTGE